MTCALMLLVALLSVVPAGPASALAAPGGMTPTNGASVTSVPVLSWNAVTDAQSYQVQVSTADTFASTVFDQTVIAPSASLPKDLSPGTYYWRVRTYDGANSPGPYSPAENFVRSAAEVPTPTSPADNATMDYPADTPVLRWTAMSGVKSYDVQWSTNINFTSGGSDTVASANTLTASYALRNSAAPRVMPGRDYYWRVRSKYATNASDLTSEYSTPRKFSLVWDTDTDPNGAKPLLLAPPNDNSTANAVMNPEFRWDPVAGAAKYRIQVSASPDLTNPVVNEVVVRNSFTPQSSLTSGAYYWRVTAMDGQLNEGPWSAIWEFYRDWRDGAVSARPTISVEDADGGTSGVQMYKDEILVQWDSIPGASHYEVQFASSDNSSFGNAAASKLATCKTPNTAITPVFAGSYSPTTKLSACNILKGGSLDLWTQSKTYVRVRAVDVKTSSGELPSLWSDQARVGESAPGPVEINLLDPPTSGDSDTAPAVQTGPGSGHVATSNPVLRWARVQDTNGSNKYLVAMSKSANFDASVLTELSTGKNYVVVSGTRLVLQEELLNSQSGESYYWYVLPCRVWENPTSANNVCPVADSAAINQTGKYRAFRKVAPKADGLASAVIGGTDATGYRLSWRDQVVTEETADGSDSDPEHSYTPAGTKYHQVEVSTDPDFTDSGKRVLQTTTDATALIPQIAWNPTETYYWRVRAMDGVGTYLAWSATASISPAGVPAPNSPGTTGQGSMPSLTWAVVPGAASYEVELNSDTGGTFPLVSRVAGYPATTEYPGLTPSAQLVAGTYSWRVRAVDALNIKGDWATGGLGYTVGLASPSPTLPANAATKSMSDLTFTWNPVVGAAEYALTVSTASDVSSTYDSQTLTGTSWTPTKSGGYAPGTYYWRVQARSTTAGANGLLSSGPIRSFTVTRVPGAPASVNVAASATLGGSLDVSWTPPASNGGRAVSGYRIFMRPSAGSWSEVLPAPAANAGARTVTGLGNGTTYEVRMASSNADGSGPFSSVKSAATGAAPLAPTSLKATPALNGAKATWGKPTAVPPVSGFTVRYRPVGGSWTQTTTSATSLDLTSLAGGAPYELEVLASNVVGNGPWATTTFTTLASPGAPTSVAAAATTGGATITWSPPAQSGTSAVSGYSVKYRKVGTATWSSKSATASPATLSSLTAGAPYEATVSAKNSAGPGPESAAVTFTPLGTTSTPKTTPTSTPTAAPTPVLQKPGAPISVTGKAKGKGKKRALTVKWAAGAGGAPSGYTAQVSLNGKKWTSKSSTTTSAKFPTKKGKKYKVRVMAKNGAGASAYSTVVTIKG